MIEYSGEIRPLGTDLSILDRLELEKPPVGVKFLFEKPQGVRRLKKNMAICLMPGEAQNSGAFYVDRTHFEFAEPLFLGIRRSRPLAAPPGGAHAGVATFGRPEGRVL